MRAARNPLTTALKRMGACSESIEWAKSYVTLQEAWNACERGDWMLWLLATHAPDRNDLFPVAAAFTERALGCAAAALESAAGAPQMPKKHTSTLRIHADILRSLRVDSRAAAGAASDAAWAASAAAGAAHDAAGAAHDAAGAAHDAAGAAHDAAWAAHDAAWAASAAAGAAHDAAGAAHDAAGAAESRWQTDYIRTRFACPVVTP